MIVFESTVVFMSQLVLAQSMMLVIVLDMAILFVTLLSINVKLASVSTHTPLRHKSGIRAHSLITAKNNNPKVIKHNF